MQALCCQCAGARLPSSVIRTLVTSIGLPPARMRFYPLGGLQLIGSTGPRSIVEAAKTPPHPDVTCQP